MSTLEELQSVIDKSKRIVFFGGAGVSTESGIPDFRSVDGLYNQKYDYPPEQILSHTFFVHKTSEFFRFYRDKMLCLDKKPNKAHYKLAELEKAGKLSAVVTQNIDGLHQAAGSKRVYELHGRGRFLVEGAGKDQDGRSRSRGRRRERVGEGRGRRRCGPTRLSSSAPLRHSHLSPSRFPPSQDSTRLAQCVLEAVHDRRGGSQEGGAGDGRGRAVVYECGGEGFGCQECRVCGASRRADRGAPVPSLFLSLFLFALRC